MGDETRRDRLAAALRANLRRRKAGGDVDAPAPASPADQRDGNAAPPDQRG